MGARWGAGAAAGGFFSAALIISSLEKIQI
jgi:hypothetical protein